MKKIENIFFRAFKNITSIIAFCIIIFSIFSMILLTIFFTNKSMMTVKENAIISATQVTGQIANSLNIYLQNIENVSNELVNEINKDGITKRSEIEVLLNNACLLITDIDSIALYDSIGATLALVPKKVELKDNTNVTQVDWYKSAIESDEVYRLSPPHVQSLYKDRYNWVFTSSSKLLNNGVEYMMGIDMKFNVIEEHCGKIAIGKRGYVFIVDKDNNIIYHPKQQLIYSGIENEDIGFIGEKADGSYINEADNSVVVISSLKNTEWKIIGVSFIKDFESTINEMIRFILMVFSIIFIIVILFSKVIAEVISSPLHKLIYVMDEVEKGDLEIDFNENTYYEAKRISISFNRMLDRIKILLTKIKEEETELRKTELKALQAQINPHFLYNTLDSIMWMCEKNKGSDAAIMVAALANLFRISISKGNEIITIEKEIIHAKSYLTIQNIRYKNQFEYKFNVDEQLIKYKCLKVLLQPIIENAIYHGVSMMVDKGNIEVNIFSKENNIVMEVRDNGMGMSEDILGKILESDIDTYGIGIKNVNSRIQIYFGKEYGVTIKSELDEGTCITILIPKLEVDYVER